MLQISAERKPKESRVPSISVEGPTPQPPATINDELVLCIKDGLIPSSTVSLQSFASVTDVTMSSPDNGSITSEQVTSGVEDISQPPSISHSPTPSFDVDQASDSDCKSENESISTTTHSTSETVKEPRVSVNSSSSSSTKSYLRVPSTSSKSESSKKKQLLTLVAARQQNNLAQAKSLLAMLEHNQRKRKKSPNISNQPISKKVRENTESSLVTQTSSKTKPKPKSTSKSDPQAKVKSQFVKAKTESDFETEFSCTTKEEPNQETASNKSPNDSTVPRSTCTSVVDQSVASTKKVVNQPKTDSFVTVTQSAAASKNNSSSVLTSAVKLLGVDSIKESKLKVSA